jgi:hypothetical protein
MIALKKGIGGGIVKIFVAGVIKEKGGVLVKILIEGKTIRLTGIHDKAIQIYHNEANDSFSFSVCQNGMEIGALPIIIFCKEHTVVMNNLPQGKSFID